MGSKIHDWAQVTGESAAPIFIGAGSAWGAAWLVVAIGLCVVACVIGSRHELDAYKRIKDQS